MSVGNRLVSEWFNSYLVDEELDAQTVSEQDLRRMYEATAKGPPWKKEVSDIIPEDTWFNLWGAWFARVPNVGIYEVFTESVWLRAPEGDTGSLIFGDEAKTLRMVHGMHMVVVTKEEV